MTTAPLPPLPEPDLIWCDGQDAHGYATFSRAHTADQMQACATAARADLEAELVEQARIVGMGAERELALMARVESLEAENARLRGALEDISQGLYSIWCYVQADSHWVDAIYKQKDAADAALGNKDVELRTQPKKRAAKRPDAVASQPGLRSSS